MGIELGWASDKGIKVICIFKNGAKYSILSLGIIMILDSFGYHIPPYVSPIITFATVGYFFHKSRISIKELEKTLEENPKI